MKFKPSYVVRAVFFLALIALIFVGCDRTVKYDLTVEISPEGTGTVDPSEGQFEENTIVELSVTPNEDWSFSKWQGTHGNEVVERDGKWQINMDSDKDILAVFEEILSLQVNRNPQEGGTVVIEPEKDFYQTDDEVVLTAVPAAGYLFESWSGDLSSVENPLTVVMDTNKGITANFREKEKVATPIITPDGGDYPEPVQVTISCATEGATIRYTLDGSQPAPDHGIIYQEPITVDTSLLVSAIAYGENMLTSDLATVLYDIVCTLTITSYPSEGGRVHQDPLLTKYPYNSQVTLEAEASDGFYFKGWEGDIVSDSNPVNLVMDADKNVTATFMGIDAFLSSLEISDCQLKKGERFTMAPIQPEFEFDPYCTEYYTTAIKNEVKQISIIPVARDSQATVLVDGQEVEPGDEINVSLNPGENIISIEVTARDGETRKTYTINAHRSEWELVGSECFVPAWEKTFLFADNGTLYAGSQDYSQGVVYSYSGDEWKPVGDTEFTPLYIMDFCFYLDQGTPYAAFRNNNKTSCLKYDGVEWVSVGEETSKGGGQLSLFVEDGVPYITGLGATIPGPFNVAKFDGSAWKAVGDSFGKGVYPNIFVENGTPYVAYGDMEDPSGSGATVMKFDGTDWAPVGEARLSPSVANIIDLYVKDGVPYIAFEDGPGFEKPISVMKYTGTTWKFVGPRFLTGIGSWSERARLLVDGDSIYLAYHDFDHGVIVLKYDGNEWNLLGGIGVSGLLEWYTAPSIVVEDGVVYVLYNQLDDDWDTKLTVRKFTE